MPDTTIKSTATIAKNYPHQTTIVSSHNTPAPNTMHGQFLRHPLGCTTYGEYVAFRDKLNALLDAPARIDIWCGKQKWQPVGGKGSAAYCLWHAFWKHKLGRKGTRVRVVLIGSEQVIREYVAT